MYDPDPIRVFLIGSRTFGCAVRDLILRRGGFALVGVCAPEGDALATGTILPAVHMAAPSAAMLPPLTDLIVAAHNHRFIPPAMLAATRLGGLSYHPSLLPIHRGRDAVAWTIRDRDRIAGGTVYWLDERIDAGPIAAQDWCFVRPDDTPSTLWRRELFPLGLRLIDQALGDLLTGRSQRRPQDEDLATWEPALIRPALAARGAA
ncbi:methionyl-tRNA formyltransferase [Planctomycetota bacterium]|nr:methionyl-tRNA formyltransferase [Planctomycetota bacterium]